ncbi:MAG: hypothetical protein IJ901_04620 [Bacteroidaceae bacterium]|nr:hypothetical protein [Bacteroidaceae bacterium]
MKHQKIHTAWQDGNGARLIFDCLFHLLGIGVFREAKKIIFLQKIFPKYLYITAEFRNFAVYLKGVVKGASEGQ